MQLRRVSRHLQLSLAWIPRRVRREFQTRGGDKRFLVWVSFLAAFVWGRLFYFFNDTLPHFKIEGQIEFGRQTVIAGYHPHHIFSGIVLVALAGWLALHYGGPQVQRVSAVMYGLGLGLIVDELGYVIEGFQPADGFFPEIFVSFMVVGAVLMSAVYFPQFWATLQRPVRSIWRRGLERRRGRARAPQERPAGAPGSAEPVPVSEPPLA